jgi:hypothetical protein
MEWVNSKLQFSHRKVHRAMIPIPLADIYQEALAGIVFQYVRCGSESGTSSPAVFGKVHNIGKCTSRTDNDDYKYAYNKCRHAGTSDKQHSHLSAPFRR